MKKKNLLLIFLVVSALLSTPSLASNEAELKEKVATIINLNGYLCAKVLDIRPLEVRPNVYEVTCVEYRGGSGKKVYMLDAANGTAWEA